MKQTTIYLIRHGDVINPKKLLYGRLIPVDLSKKGWKQMGMVAKKLQDSGVMPDVFYSSQHQRAIDSVKAMQKIFSDVPHYVEEDLQDVDHFGIRDKNIHWLETKGKDLYAMKEFKNSIERPEHMATRIITVIKKIAVKNPEKTLFVIVHGDPSGYALWRILYKDKPFPPRFKLLKKCYLEKGEMRKLMYDPIHRSLEAGD